MKKVFRKSFQISLLAIALTACGSNSGSQNKSETSSSSQIPSITSVASITQPTSSSSATSQPAPAPVGSSLTMWTCFGGDYGAVIDRLVGEFNSDHQDSIYVEHTKKVDVHSLSIQILNSISTSTFPNIATTNTGYQSEFFSKGIVLPLDSYIARYNEEHNTNLINDFYGEYTAENLAISYDESGNPYIAGLPFNRSTEVMLCNGYYFDYFKSLDSTIFVPSTWEELYELTPKLNAIIESQNLRSYNSRYLIGKIDANNHAYDFRISDTNELASGEHVLQELGDLSYEKDFYALGYDSPERAFSTVLHHWGVPYTKYLYDDYRNNEQYGKAYFWQNTNKAATTAALQFFVDLNSEKGFGFPSNFNEIRSCAKPLEEGRCLFTITSSAALSEPHFENKRLDMYPILYKDADHKYVYSEGTNMCLLNQFSSRERYNQETYDAFTAMVDLTTGKHQAQWASTVGYFPVSKSAHNHSIYQDMLNNNYPTRLQSLYRSAGQINFDVYQIDWIKYADPGFRDSQRLFLDCGTAFRRILSGTSIESAMNELWSGTNPAIKG